MLVPLFCVRLTPNFSVERSNAMTQSTKDVFTPSISPADDGSSRVVADDVGETPDDFKDDRSWGEKDSSWDGSDLFGDDALAEERSEEDGIGGNIADDSESDGAMNDSPPNDATARELRQNDSDDAKAVDRHSVDKMESKKVRAESFRLMASVGNFGLFLLLAIIFGYFIGNGLDSFFGTKPVFTVFWVVCAVIASIRELWRSVHRARQLGED